MHVCARAHMSLCVLCVRRACIYAGMAHAAFKFCAHVRVRVHVRIAPCKMRAGKHEHARCWPGVVRVHTCVCVCVCM